MKLKNVSNYPVTVNGIRIETGEVEDVEIEDVEIYRNDRRFSLEEDDELESEEDVEENDDKLETSNPEEQKTEEGDE